MGKHIASELTGPYSRLQRAINWLLGASQPSAPLLVPIEIEPRDEARDRR